MTGIIQRLIRGAPAILLVLMGLGTAINVVAVLVGGGIGTLVGANLPEVMRHTALQAIGIVTLLVGVANFLLFGMTCTRKVPTLTLVTVQ
jgi:uncharacterized membrane protein YqgA involved in biofilm formation